MNDFIHELVPRHSIYICLATRSSNEEDRSTLELSISPVCPQNLHLVLA